MCDDICARSPVLENKVPFNQILTLQLAQVWQILQILRLANFALNCVNTWNSKRLELIVMI